MVLDTGLPFEVVAGFTDVQFMAIQKAVQRRWEMKASIMGAQVNDTKASTVDDTEALENRVKKMKKATGKKSLDLWEVI